MKNLLVLATSFLVFLNGCSVTPIEPKLEAQTETKVRASPLPMMIVNPGSVIHTSVNRTVIVFPQDIIINITETETLVTFTDAFSGNRTTVQGDIDMTFLKSTDYKIVDWRKNK